MKFPRLYYPFTLLFWIILLIACSEVDSSWQDIEEAGVIRIGLDPTYPPFEATDGNTLWGLDVDLGNAIAGKLGVQTEFVYFGYDGLYDALTTNQVDVLLSALVPVESRMRDFAYTDSYFNAGQVLVVPEASNITELPQLSGQSIGVEMGSAGHVIATNWQRNLEDITIIQNVTADEAMESVLKGTSQVAVTDHVSARLYLRDKAGLALYDSMLTDEPYTLVVQAGEDELRLKLNQALSDLVAEGELESIISRWLDG